MKNIFKPWFQLLSWTVLLAFVSNVIGQDAAQAWSIAEPQNIIMPAPGMLISSSPAFSLPTLKAISIDPNDPFKIDFVVDSANQSLSEKIGQEQVNLLIKYFLSFLTLPEEDLWVNLSPYEKNHIITSDFEITNAGRDMLVQDYILKQLASSLTYPDHEIGKVFWKRVFNRAKAEYGTSNIPVISFNKVWVVPQSATVYEENGSAYISESRLKVLTEEDYLSTLKNRPSGASIKEQKIDHISSEITREIILPELEREVNEGKYFAPLRQMYNSLILAIWFKKRFREDLIGRVYVNQKKIFGIALGERQIKDKIYAQYLKAFKKGVYNYIKEEDDPISNEVIPRKYFSGGFSFADAAMKVNYKPAWGLFRIRDQIGSLRRGFYRFTVALNPVGISKKNLMSLMAGMALMGSVQQANAHTNIVGVTPLPGDIQSNYISTQPLIALQKALNKVHWNTGSLLGDHPGAVGYEKLERIIDAINYLPSDSPLQAQAQQLKKDLLNPQFFKDNIDKRNQGTPHGDYLLMHPYKTPASKTAVDTDIDGLKKEIAKLLSSTHYIYTAPSNSTPWIAPAVVSAPATPVPVVPIAVPAPVQERTHPDASVNPMPVSPLVTTTQAILPTAPVPTATIVPIISSTLAPEPAPSPIVSTPAVTPSGALAPAVAYSISDSLTPFFTESSVMSKQTGFVNELVRTNTIYREGKPVLYIVNQALETRIKSLTAAVKTNQDNLSHWQDLFDQQLASAQELSLAQQRLAGASADLAEALQEKTAGQVVAPYDLKIKSMALKDGMTVANGQVLFTDYDLQRVSFILEVPPSLSPSRFENFSINGNPVKSIVSIEKRLDPQEKNAQWIVVVEPSKSIFPGQKVEIKADVLAPDTSFYPALYSINSPMSTLSAIGPVEEYSINPPEAGSVKFLVHDGQLVEENQPVAIEYSGHNYEDYQNTRQALSGIDFQLSHAKDGRGNPLLTSDQLASLNIQRAALVSKLQGLQSLIERLVIHAPACGIVSGLNIKTGVFQSEDTLFTIVTGTAQVGSVNDSTITPVLLPQGLTINEGDPVIVETGTGGIRFPGKVTQVNPSTNLISSTMSLSGSQAIEVMAYGQPGILQSNLPVNIIWPTNDVQKNIISNALAQVESAQSTASAGAPPPPDPVSIFAQQSSSGIFVLSGVTNNPVLFTGATVSTNLAPATVTLNMVDAQVGSNPWNSYLEVAEYNKRKLSENAAYDTRISLFGGPVMSGSQIKWNYGVAGMFANSIQGGLQSGSAINVAAPLISDFFVNLIPILDGEAHKQRLIAQKETEEAFFHKQAVIKSAVDAGEGLAIEIGGAQVKMKLLVELQKELADAQRVIRARELAGASVEAESVDNEKKVLKNEGDIKLLQSQIDKWTVALNFLMGRSNLNTSIVVSLPLGKEFGSISAQTVEGWLGELVGTNSPDPEIREFGDALDAAKKSARLAGLKDYLPTVNITGVNSSATNSVGNSSVGLSPNESALRTSTLQPGLNAHLGGQLDIYDSARGRKEKMLAQDVRASMAAREKKEIEKKADLLNAVDAINSLSEQIQLAQTAYENAYLAWEAKAELRDINLSYRLVDDRIEMNALWQKIVDLKMKYFNEEATLRQLGLLGPESSTQGILLGDMRVFQTVVSNSIPGNLGTGFPSLTNNLESVPGQSSTGLLTPGVVIYPRNDLTGQWVLGHEAPLESVKQILFNDPNPVNRVEALRYFLFEYQNNKAFLPVLKEIVLNSSHADVIWELLKYMGTQEDHGVRFFVEIINDAGEKHDQLVVDLAFRSLEDVFTTYPDILQGLASSDFTDHLKVDKVFLTLIARQLDSPASQRLLQSDYWNADDLAKIYNSLNVYNNAHKGDQNAGRIEALSQLIYDSILRKEALANIDETFRSGYFAKPSVIVLNSDVLTHGRIEEITEQNRVFLNLSPQWRRMQEYIHPKLYASAQEAANNLLSLNQVDPLFSLFDDFLGVPAEHNELAYFVSLGLDGQRAYITELNKIHNISELARIINFRSLQTPLRAMILDDLMADRQGRFLVLKTYVGSFDDQLLQSIEERSWLEKTREDVKTFKNSIDIEILRGALTKMYDRTQAQWTWDVIDSLSSSDPELHLLRDPRGEAYKTAQINVAATKIAIGALEETRSYRWVWWAGYRLQSPQEVNELARLKQEIDQQIDPIKIMADFDHRAKSVTDGKTRKMLNNIISMRDQLAVKIANNDQSIPKFPVLWWVTGALALLGSMFLFFKNLLKRIKVKTLNKDTVSNILYIADRVTSLEYMDKLNGAETNEPNKKMVQTRDDGLEIINMPHPRNVEPKAKIYLESWWQQVMNWNKGKGLSSDDILRDFHQMKESALDALRSMPYDPKMMQSPSGQYQKTLFYFTTMANYSLYLLTKQLGNKSLSTVQKEQLRRDTDGLVKSIKYASNFSLFLHYRANIQRVLTRKLPDDHPLEQRKWYLLGASAYGVARIYLLFEYLFSRSLKRGNKSLDDLLSEGNELLGLYPDKEKIKTESKDYLTDVVQRGGMDQVVRAHDAEIRDKIGNFWREIKYPIQAGVILLSTLASILVFPGIASFAAEISSFAILFHLWSVWFYSKPNIDFLDTTWSKEINELAGQQQGILNELIDAAQLTSSEGSVKINDVAMTAPDEIDQRIIAQLMAGYSADRAAPELLMPIIEKNLSGEGENIKVEDANLKRLFYLIRLFKDDSLSNRLKKSNSKEILFISSLRSQEDFRPTTIENLNRDLPVIHINFGVREYYFIVGATYPTLVRMKDAAMNVATINRRGGVDFSKAESSISFQRKSSVGSNILATGTLKSFKGFDFQVIQYRPILNLKELFLGSAGKSGIWFSSKACSLGYNQV